MEELIGERKTEDKAKNFASSIKGFQNSLLINLEGNLGAGKTTFMDIITGKTKPDSGDVIWGERNISLLRKSESQIAQLGVGRKFQKPTVFENKTVEDNLMISLSNRRTFFFALTYDYNEQEKMRVAEIAELVNLDVSLDKKAGDLSHGQKQWLEIGMLLTQDPKLLLIDEPAAGMTVNERKKTVQILRKLSSDKSVIVVEHDMEFVKDLECEVTVLHEGKILAEGSIESVSSDKNVVEVYLGR